MAKQKWDGNFNEAYWVDRENPVEELIENSGRILREPTSDGYTHDIVYRAGYVSEDYYFPNPARTNGHDHYELHSTGDIVINGKKITRGGTGTMKHGRQLSRNKSLDGTILKKESGDQVDEGTKLHELGVKFESDKAKLEDEIDKVQNSKISETDKRKLIAQLNAAIEALQEQYDRDVTEEEERVQEELMGQIDSMQEAADELERQAADLRSIKMEAAATDASAAVDAADAQKQAFEQMKAEYVEKLNLQIEQAAIQQRNIRNRRLSGR